MPALNTELLRILAARGEMPVRELVLRVKRARNDYTDFYGLAALFHAGWIEVDTTEEGTSPRNWLGSDIQETAQDLCQISLPAGQKFQINGCDRVSWHDFPVTAFLSASGYRKLEEIDLMADDMRRRRKELLLTAAVAVAAALIGAYATAALSHDDGIVVFRG